MRRVIGLLRRQGEYDDDESGERVPKPATLETTKKVLTTRITTRKRD